MSPITSHAARHWKPTRTRIARNTGAARKCLGRRVFELLIRVYSWRGEASRQAPLVRLRQIARLRKGFDALEPRGEQRTAAPDHVESDALGGGRSMPSLLV